MAVQSLLKLGIEALEEGAKFKNPQAAANALAKKGVKPEELEYADLQLPARDITKQDLVMAEQKRADWFTTEEVPSQYQSYSLPGAAGNPTYKEKVLQYRERGALERGESGTGQEALGRAMDDQGSRYTSEHFPDVENYLAHTRVYDDTLEGTETRVLQEIQSDLHQQGRQQGYDVSNLTQETYHAELDDIRQQLLNIAIKEADWDSIAAKQTTTPDLIEELTLDEVAFEKVDNLASRYSSIQTQAKTMGNPQQSPFEKTWLRKGIERELNDAIAEGRQQLAIPIKGAVADLHRAEGVQKWYETQVLNTAKKVAKQSGSELKLVTRGNLSAKGNEITGDALKGVFEKYKAGLADGSVNILSLRNNIGRNANITLTEAEEVGRKLMRGEITSSDELADAINSYSNVTYAVIKPKFGSTQPLSKMEQDELAELSLKETMGEDFDAARMAELEARTFGEGAEVKYTKPNLSFSLYSTPAAAGFPAYMMYKQGATDQQVTDFFLDKGYDLEEIEEINRAAQAAAEMEAAGANEQQIGEFFNTKDVTTDTVEQTPLTPVPGVPDERTDYSGFLPGTSAKETAYNAQAFERNLSPEEFIASAYAIYPSSLSAATSVAAFFGNEAAQRRLDYVTAKQEAKIVDLAKKNNINLIPQDGQWYYADEQGNQFNVTPGFWDAIAAERGELLGGITGGTGAFLASRNLLIGTGGAVAGASSGAELDYMIAATKLNEEAKAEDMAVKGIKAAEIAIIGEIVGAAAVQGIIKAGTGVASITKTLKDRLISGSTDDAYRALKESFFIDDATAQEAAEQLKRVIPLEGTDKEQAIQATVLTQPRVQDLLAVTAQADSQASRAVAKMVTDRARDVLESTAKLTGDTVPKQFMQDLQNYTSDVKMFYSAVKSKTAQTPGANNFSWDYDKLAIEPALEELHKNILKLGKGSVLEKYTDQAQAIRAMTDSRTFTDLIDMRQLVNEMLYNKRMAKAADKTSLRQVLANIDNAIEDGANTVMEKPQAWLSDWYKARSLYTQMKNVEQTALYRAVFDKKGKPRPVQPQTVVKALGRYITALDGSFEDVMRQLPVTARSQYEGAVVDSLAQRFTAKADDGTTAINFPMLADELDKITLTTKEARQAKAALKYMGETFKNDLALAAVSSNIQVPKAMQALTADITAKAKFQLASGIFSKIKQVTAIGKEGRNWQLVKVTADFLENPLHQKSFKELVESRPDLAAQAKELQQAYAQQAAQKRSVTAKVFEGGKLKPPVEGAAAQAEIPLHRIATLENAKKIADAEGMSMTNIDFENVLKRYGFLAIQQGTDRVKVLK